jgi:hypothetical protein
VVYKQCRVIFSQHGTNRALARFDGMDPDQDLLDQLDRQEAPTLPVAATLIAGMALLSGFVIYFTMALQPNANRELSFDAAVLIAIASGVALAVAFRKLR